MSQNTQIEALKPCPFCGGESFIQRYESGHDEPNVSWIVNCKSCHARTQSLEEDQADAIENWNRRALREAPVPSEEPVAWRYRHSEQENWHYGPGRMNWWECQPLFASPAAAPVAVSVKPLQWRDHSFKESVLHTAEMPYGQYSITYDGDCEYPFVVRPFVTKQSNYETLEAAKADCEIDYRERILSSIIPATKGGEHLDDAIIWIKNAMANKEFPPAVIERGRAVIAALAQDTDATPPSHTEEKAL